ncbi:hypothetical protein CRENPOLYSF1_450007 [Crenothrix polyspora]|uniref:Uncharacterized protein n=1 Tax=Crenothrix polyspora TaxID=360316 RepID=A0A1R4HBM5_9GAMM|nr:hypothetical protein CRENPOLYSF1_450007 [Crenothrix polyspora]
MILHDLFPVGAIYKVALMLG